MWISGAWREHLTIAHLHPGNAPALLSRALGLKKIDDLTDLIRKLVLEPSRIREDAGQAVISWWLRMNRPALPSLNVMTLSLSQEAGEMYPGWMRTGVILTLGALPFSVMPGQ